MLPSRLATFPSSLTNSATVFPELEVRFPIPCPLLCVRFCLRFCLREPFLVVFRVRLDFPFRARLRLLVRGIRVVDACHCINNEQNKKAAYSFSSCS
jgi:hypothetical protein